MTDHQPPALHPPLFISARLMAAVRTRDGATIHIEPAHREADRVVWHYVIEDSDGTVLSDATDLRGGTGDGIDTRQALTTLLGFLGAAADAHRHTLTGHDSENADLFPPEVTDWAYEHDDELAELAHQFEQLPRTPAPTRTETPADRDARWWHAWSRTGCADCAGAAAEGRAWGPNHCWAIHRPHRPHGPKGDRLLTAARRDQGFVSQAHLDAFYAYSDHVNTCADCQRPGPPEPIDDGIQPTKIECPTGIDLFRQAFFHNFDPS